MNGPAVASSTSPAMPLPPLPRMTTCSMSSRAGSRSNDHSVAAAAATCSGKPRTAPHMSSESIMTSAFPGSSFERGRDAVGVGLGDQAIVLGVVDRLGLVDEHDRDVVLDGVLPLETRVVEAVLALEVEQGTFVLGTREDLEQLRVERHRAITLPWRHEPPPRAAPRRRRRGPRG